MIAPESGNGNGPVVEPDDASSVLPTVSSSSSSLLHGAAAILSALSPRGFCVCCVCRVCSGDAPLFPQMWVTKSGGSLPLSDMRWLRFISLRQHSASGVAQAAQVLVQHLVLSWCRRCAAAGAAALQTPTCPCSCSPLRHVGCPVCRARRYGQAILLQTDSNIRIILGVSKIKKKKVKGIKCPINQELNIKNKNKKLY